jgi:hypothetical protein
MNNNHAALFAQAPGLASSFNDIFNNTATAPVAPPTPAVLSASHPAPSKNAGK